MATSLASQLKKLSAPQTNLLDEKRDRVSIIFNSSEAAKYGKDVYYEIGKSGFDELLKVNKDFLQFKYSLFGKTTKDFQRAVEDKEANAKLDEQIEHFLLLLSPYLEKQAALKALEWLIYRFMVSDLNRNALLMCIFPYYESALFVRILQVIHVRGATNDWHWLSGAQKSGRPLTKQAVFTRWGNYQSFRGFMSDYLMKMLKIHKTEANLKIAIYLYVSTVVGGLCLLEEVKEEHMVYIMKLLPKCLSSHPEMVSGMYLIIAQLTVKTQLSQVLLNNIFKFMIQVSPPPDSVRKQCVLCVLALTQHQQVETLDDDTLRALESMPYIMKEVEELAKTKSVASFLSAYVAGTIRWLSGNSCKLNATKKSKRFTELIHLLDSMPLTSSDSSKIILSLFEAVKTHYKAIKNLKTLNLAEALNKLEVSFPEGHNQAVTHLIDLESDSQAGEGYKEIIKDVLTDFSGSTSFLHMVHPDDSIRLAAVKCFAEKVSKGQEKDDEMVKTQMKTMLADEYPPVVLEALVLTKAIKMLDVSYLVSECKKLLAKAKEEGNRWAKVKVACFRVLSQKLGSQYDADQQLSVLYECLPCVLFPYDSWEFASAKVILNSVFACKSALLSSIATEVKPYLVDKDEPKVKEYCKKIWSVLPRILSTLPKEEHLAFWDYVKSQLGSEDCMRSHYMCMVLLFCGLGDHKLHEGLRLTMAHRLLDACIISFDTFKVSADISNLVLKQPSPSYLKDCLQQVMKGSLPVSFLTGCLKQAVQVFKLPNVCSTSSFWTLQMEEAAGEGNLLLLIKAMKGALQLERFDKMGNILRNDVVATVMKDCLKTDKRRFCFLALMWGWHPSLNFCSVIDETLQAWSLNLGSALLSSQSTSLAWALGTNQPLVPALLSALTHGSVAVRCGAIECVKRLGLVIGGRLSQNNHSLLLEALIEHADEVIADESHVPTVLLGCKNKLKSKSSQVIQALLEMVASEFVPMHLKAAVLYALAHVTDSAVLLNLLPIASNILKQVFEMKEESKLDMASSLSLYYILLRFIPSTSVVLESASGWELFVKAVTCTKQVLVLPEEIVSPQSIMMNQVLNRKFFTGIKTEEVKSKLWSILISRIVESEDSKEATQLQKGLRKVSLDAAAIIKQIDELNLTEKVTTIKAAQAKRIKQREKVNYRSHLVAWKKLGLMLETIGVMTSLDRPWLLVSPLCQCLQSTLTMDTVITEMVQQQILSALLHLMQKSAEQLGEDVSKQVQLNIELVVQCIRSSVSPDTHRRALLVLAFAAKISPDTVMHNMIPIFTFMGSSLLKRDDSYSFQVIHQTVQSIVPALIKQSEGKENLRVKLAQVCQVFVDALPDLPEHRCLPLFTQLATTIDASKNLWILLALIADSHVLRGSIGDAASTKEEDKRGFPPDIYFALILWSQFPVVTQVFACCQLINYISNLPEEKEDLFAQGKLLGKHDKLQSDIIRWDLHTPRQMCHFKYTSIGLIAHLLSSEKFVQQLLEGGKEEEGKLQQLYKLLLEKTMCYLRAVSLSCEHHKDKPGGRVLLSLQRKVLDVIDGVNALLPSNMLIEVTRGLLVSPLPLVRCRAMEILCSKLQPIANYFSEKDSRDLRQFVKILRKVAIEAKEPLDNRQTALFALQLLTKYLAPIVSHNALMPALTVGVSLVCRQDAELKLVTQALLLVSEAVVAVKAHSVQCLSQLMPVFGKLLDENQDSDHIHLATITAIHKLVENVPQLLSPYLKSLICSVCQLCTRKEIADVKESRLILRLSTVRDALVKQVEPRVLIPELTKVYQHLSEVDVPALQTFMIMVERLVSQVDAGTLTTHKPALLHLFTQALDLRTEKGDTETICKLEESISCGLGKLLLRLNEHDNIAIFLSLHSWAEEKPSRLITFYRFADHLAGTFKVLFIKAKLADNIFSHAATLLERNNTLNHKDTIFGNGDEADKSTSTLLLAVLDTLTKIFIYDSVNFTNQERFQLMVNPLTDQLENNFGSSEVYHDRVTNHLIPCILKFTIAVGDDSLWKILNQQILLRVRNDDQPMVSLAALETFKALIETLGEDYLQPLLADTMPYITEVLESLDPDVGAAAREIFTKMEGILGDNLRAYLDY